ncbi:keratin, type II cytoskeletal 8-like [Protopterus annectens]|uniref:keratin, type II cytoskeletal 8-like n=1 Tax=Protopterus annectens TaxID=7888 RepID=UPI001CFA2576|nr:keratin, type II cytoskeletal 8-like [Protopterus annectens]
MANYYFSTSTVPDRRSNRLIYSSQSYTQGPSRVKAARASSVTSSTPGLYCGLRPGTGSIGRSTGASISSILASSPTYLLSSSPLQLDVDPQLHQVRSQEKDQIKGLNNKFANFIEEVRRLELKNKKLDTELKILQDKDSYKSNIDQLLSLSLATIRQQIDNQDREKDRLVRDLANVQTEVQDLKSRYEDEINRRNDLENDFVVTKKEVDDCYLQKVELDSKVDSFTDENELLKLLFSEETKELQSQVHNAEVVVSLDNSRDLEMSHIINDVKSQYETMAAKARDESEQWYRMKIDDMANEAAKYNDELKRARKEMADLTRFIQRLNGEIDVLKNQRANLENAIGQAEEQGEQALQNARDQVQELEEALKKMKQDMALQLRKYQELMDLKMALDIEIQTYRKMLEGEEMRIGNPKHNIQIRAIDKLEGFLPPDSRELKFVTTSFAPAPVTPKKPILVKTVETRAGKIISESTHVTE